MTSRDTASSLDSIQDGDGESSDTDPEEPSGTTNEAAVQPTDSEAAGGETNERSDDGASEGADDADGLEGAPEPPSPPKLPQDSVFEILKNERRRITLKYLMQEDGRVKLSDLAEHVAVQENDTTRQTLTSTERKRAYVGLYQCHLPKMDELGAVDFNRDRGIIELGPNIDQFKPYLDGPADPDPWPRYYLGLAGVNAAVFVAAFGATLALGGELLWLVTAAVGALAVLSFAVLATVHHRRWNGEDDDAGLVRE